MLMFYLPIIIFEAMLSNPRRDGAERKASTKEVNREATEP